MAVMNGENQVMFRFLTVASTMSDSWVVAPYKLVEFCQRFRNASCHRQDVYKLLQVYMAQQPRRQPYSWLITLGLWTVADGINRAVFLRLMWFGYRLYETYFRCELTAKVTARQKKTEEHATNSMSYKYTDVSMSMHSPLLFTTITYNQLWKLVYYLHIIQLLLCRITLTSPDKYLELVNYKSKR